MTCHVIETECGDNYRRIGSDSWEKLIGSFWQAWHFQDENEKKIFEDIITSSENLRLKYHKDQTRNNIIKSRYRR